MKSCSNVACKQTNPQPFENFGKNKKGRNGLYCHCKSCHRLAGRNRYNRPNGRLLKFKDAISRYWPELTRDEAYNEYMRINALQNNTCAICKRSETEIDAKYGTVKMLAVDHCHTTGKVRGLLCSKHNRGIGQLGDCWRLCIAAAAYLFKFR